ncbi:MAG: hypothetical protein ACQ9CV_01830 [Nitrosopumilus sp.]|jgi:hypothetical protein
MNFLFLILPLVLLAFISNNAYAIDYDLECPENKTIVVRMTNPNPVCVFDSTAERWVGLGIAEFVDVLPEEHTVDKMPENNTLDIIPEEMLETLPEDDGENLAEVLGFFSSMISDIHYDNIPDELSRAQSYLVTFSNGEFTEPLTIQTFHKVQPGEGDMLITSLQDAGFDTFFSLSSTPSKDKIAFYNVIAQTINAGKDPELFDVSIDVLAGDNSSIVAINYNKCEITDYLPFTQDFLLFYQFSETIGSEIRDSTTIYCNGINLEVYNDEKQKIIPDEQLPYNPTPDESIKGYVVHFNGPDFDGLHTFKTFSDFSPSINFLETEYDVMTIPGNPIGSKPQFFLESLPSVDKLKLYKYYAMYVNPGQPPKTVDVSIDLITGDETILQRWNYIDCSIYDHNSFLEDSFLKFSYSEKPGPEIRDRSEFTCAGTNIEVHGDEPIPTFPIRDSKNNEQKFDITPTIAPLDDRADSFRISAFEGDFIQTHSTENLQKFESIRRDAGPLTPLNHAKQFDYGFLIESLPEKNKAPFYEFVSKYVNPVKSPEPFDVSLEMITGSGDVLYTLEYVNCDAIDFMWYLQQGSWYYQFSEAESSEIRERYIFYCEGFGLDFPQP